MTNKYKFCNYRDFISAYYALRIIYKFYQFK